MVRRTTALIALGLIGCGGELRALDVSDIRGPALAFIVDVNDNEPTQLGPAIQIDEDGFLVNGNQEYRASGDSSHVIVIAEDVLREEAGLYRGSLRIDELYTTRLAKIDVQAQPFEDDTGAWLPLRLPSNTEVRPADSAVSFPSFLQVELPIERNYSCAISGELKDFAAEVGPVMGGVPNFNDFHVISSNRVLVSSAFSIMDLRLDEPLSTAAPGPRFYEAAPDEAIGQIQANPRQPSQIWATKRTEVDGALQEFLIDDEGIQPATAEDLPTKIIALAVRSDGTPVASGAPPSDARHTNVHVFDGTDREPYFFSTPSIRQRIVAGARDQTIVLGLQGSIERLENGRWTSMPLVDKNGVVLTPRGLKERFVNGSLETWTVGDDGVLTWRTEGGEIGYLFAPVPPGFRCQEGGDVVANSLADIVIYQNRFAIIAMDVCADLLVVDLDNTDCTSLIRFPGPAASALTTNVQLHENRVWLSGDNALLRYADLQLP
ncbi:MAG: hypothetical protein WA989_16975 [Henriciella sp.]|uniref:hypothetical protein n=1 Tax=Henriciella sp. TaxID=1968823 RepID=UPI003C777BD7